MRHALVRGSIALFASIATVFGQQTPGRPCPAPCAVAGKDPVGWSDFHGVPALKRCKETVLVDTSIFTPIDDPDAALTLRSCTVPNKVVKEEVEYNPAPFTFGSPLERRTNGTNGTSLNGCLSEAETFQNKTALNLLKWDEDENTNEGAGKAAILQAAEALKDYLASQEDCTDTYLMARHGDAVVGLYVGTEVLTSSAMPVVDKVISALRGSNGVSRLAGEICRDKTPSTWTVGVFADFRGNLSATQEALRVWTEGNCLKGYDSKTSNDELDMTYVYATGVPIKLGLHSGFGQKTKPVPDPVLKRSLAARAECKPIQVDGGDGCWSLSQRCKITQKEFESYNPIKDLCGPNTLKPKQWVCCSKGDLPDMSPKPNPDGSCQSITVDGKSICWDIAETYGITVTQLEGFNKKTWGWGGCKDMQPGDRICVGRGDPPMPAPLENAMCGPRKPGTVRPTDGTKLEDVNPCPLKVCCNVWGQCGITDDFCVKAPADTGNPGTSQKGKNSCVSSCGNKITNNDKGPSTFRKIAYFEAWNEKRPCLHMDVTDIDKSTFTHIHFAFPDITFDFNVDVSKHKKQFDKMKGMSGIKRMVSFGGWAFSVESPTYTIFRDGVTDAHRTTLANNVAKFVLDNNLDGVDFDWEYPAAPDLPDIPPGALDAGKQYLEFLKAVKRRLPGKEVAIAAPASYWYLKGFPIEEIGKVVDYIVYMTYDLHGQWDHGNKWSISGCEDGDCLRSHVNKTETYDALAMVTKAGVPSHKIVVGVSSYGRSFHMAKTGCQGPMCRFTGTRNESEAMPGRCTDTEGYIANAEIREILADAKGGLGFKAKSFFDKASDSDIVVYNDDEWVAYMNDNTKKSRTDWVKGLNFGGTSDWAVDLDKDYGKEGVGDADPEKVEMGGGPKCDSAGTYDTLQKISDSVDKLHATCAQLYALNVLSKKLDQAMEKYDEVNDGYDSKFKSYLKYMKKGLPETLRKHMNVYHGEGQPYFDCEYEGEGKKWKGRCPVPMDERSKALYSDERTWMTLRDKEGFYKDLYNKTGIMEDWIEFRTDKSETKCNPSCNGLESKDYWFGQAFLKDEYEIPNPKDIVEKAMGNTNGLKTSLVARTFDVGMGTWMGVNADVVTALSVPVFLIENAIEGMEDAKELGEEAEEQEAKNKLLLILSLVFLIVPILGEAAAIAAGAAQMARVIALIGAGANAGLALKEVIENPEMAPFAIMELLTAGRLKKPKDFADAVKFRNVMKADDLKTLGDNFVKQDSMIQKIVKSCKR